MAEKKGTTIVIKKIYNVAGGHGGSWKVALADFMTALMCFFLVMWLLSQSAETKKAVSDYFSTPSIIEYNFSNFGVEITLEKLFLDLVNEPLKAFQQFMEPIDGTPNLVDQGSAKVVTAYIADQMQDVAKNVNMSADGFEFDIIDKELFVQGTSEPGPNFITAMEKLRKITTGLEDANVTVSSFIFNQSVSGSDGNLAKKIALERMDIVTKKIQSGLESPTVDVQGNYKVENKKDFVEGQTQRPPGLIRLKVKQKEKKSDGTKFRPLDNVFGDPAKDLNVYENFVKQIAEKKKKDTQE